VIGNNGVDDGQPQSCSTPSRREIRFEQFPFVFLWDSAAIVADFSRPPEAPGRNGLDLDLPSLSMAANYLDQLIITRFI